MNAHRIRSRNEYLIHPTAMNDAVDDNLLSIVQILEIKQRFCFFSRPNFWVGHFYYALKLFTMKQNANERAKEVVPYVRASLRAKTCLQLVDSSWGTLVRWLTSPYVRQIRWGVVSQPNFWCSWPAAPVVTKSIGKQKLTSARIRWIVISVHADVQFGSSQKRNYISIQSER